MNDLELFQHKSIAQLKEAAWSSLSEESRKAYQYDYNMFFEWIKKNPPEVTPTDILKYVEYLESQNMKSKTINRKIASLSKMFSILRMAGEIKNNPVEILKKVRKNVTRRTTKQVDVALTMDDVRRALKRKKRGTPQEERLYFLIKFMASTGLRVSEMIGIKYSDLSPFDAENQKIRIMGKGKKERFIFIDNETIKDIKRLWRPKFDHVFYSHKLVPYDRRSIWRLVREFFRENLDMDVHPHTLRHVFITHKISVEKKDIKAVSRYVGHADVATTLEMYVDAALDPKSAKVKI